MAHPVEDHLAAYAIRSCNAGGREHAEPDDPLRSPFEVDRHRIIESTAFRRLEGKTQVFLATHHDHFRTRLTHTLETAQVARCLAVALRANESLSEAISLAHDLGHPPFGHAGEAALDHAVASHGGFNHNTHSRRAVEYLEHPYPPFRGLNLTGETRAGLAAHATRYDTPDLPADDPAETKPRAAGFSPRGPSALEQSVPCDNASCQPGGASVEAQIASVADRLAYNCHDLEDGIGAGFVNLDQLADVQLWETAFKNAVPRRRVTHIHAIRRAVLDTLLDSLLADVIQTSRALLASVRSPAQARAAGSPLVSLSKAVDKHLADLEGFLAAHVYGQSEVVEMDARGQERVLALFDTYRKNPDALPTRFAERTDDQGLDRVICDYLAGMTDRFCEAEYRKHVASPNSPR